MLNKGERTSQSVAPAVLMKQESTAHTVAPTLLNKQEKTTLLVLLLGPPWQLMAVSMEPGLKETPSASTGRTKVTGKGQRGI